jgi:hypothetical protein
MWRYVWAVGLWSRADVWRYVGAVGLWSRADASRMKGLEIAQTKDKFATVHAMTAYKGSGFTAPFILNFNT